MRLKNGKVMIGMALSAVVLASGCASNREPQLLNLAAASTGPDEFGILPTKPLEAPKSYSELPPPTPGGENITDPTPDANAVAALGGNPAVLRRQGIGAGDGGLVTHASRYGVTSGIREALAAEDLEFRRRNDGKLLERLFNVPVYFKAYRRQSLDQYAELERMRKSGIRTPAAPPDPAR